METLLDLLVVYLQGENHKSILMFEFFGLQEGENLALILAMMILHLNWNVLLGI